MMKTLTSLDKGRFSGKKVFLRVDFNVPVNEDGEITEDLRIKSHLPTIDYLLEAGAKVLLVSHRSVLEGFESLTEQIGERLGYALTLMPFSELETVDSVFRASPLLLFDNVRLDPREEENSETFAQELAERFDFYINDAFAVSHRVHTSVVAMAKIMPACAGLLVEKEVENLSRAINAPANGKVIVLGGAKISTKMPVINNFLDKAEKILVGGALANNFFKEQGFKVGDSVIDNSVVLSFVDGARDLKTGESKLVLPTDIVISTVKTSQIETSSLKDIGFGQKIVDIGPETARNFEEIIKKSSLAVWNGPMGLSEMEDFAKGTKIIAKAVASVPNSIIGGGDTIAAVDKFGLQDKFGYVSTGGGAMLDFLAGRKLPGLEVLGYYN